MIENLERPHFFPGQWIDYRDFNALSDLPGDLLGAFSRKIVEGGGLAVTSEHEFGVVPREGLLVQVRPGSAILSNGYAVSLADDLLLNLESYRGRTIYGLVDLERTGTQPYVDPEDPSIKGFTRQKSQARVVVSDAPAVGLEIFRAKIPQHAKRMRLATGDELWSHEKDLESADPSEAVIDLRHRRLFLPLTHGQLPALELVKTRTALYEMARDIRALHRTSWVEAPVRVLSALTQLHAELLSLPIQVHRIGFWVSELASELAFWIEIVSKKTRRSEWLPLLADLGPLRRPDVQPRLDAVLQLTRLAPRLREFTQLTEKHYSVTSVISDALAESEHRRIDFSEKLVLGGYVLTRADKVAVADRHRISTTHPAVERVVRSTFASGERLSIPGLMVREGSFQTEVRVPRVTSPGVLIFRRYSRRPREDVLVEFNGRALGHLTKTEGSAEDLWMNTGFLVPEADLVAGDNQLRVTVQKADLEWGWFEAAFYQIEGKVEEPGVRS